MATFRLNTEESAGGYTHQIDITPEELTETGAGVSQTIIGLNVADGTIVDACSLHIETALEDASDAAFNDIQITVGDGNDVDRYLTATQVNANGTPVTTAVEDRTVTTLPFAYTSSDSVDVVVASTAGKSLSDIDTGKVSIFLRVIDLSDKV